MTSETEKELLLRVAQAVCHEEQMTVWSGDLAGALGANGYLRDLSYDEVVELHQTIQLELQRIIASAMQHPEASRVLREAAEGWRPIETAPDGRIILMYRVTGIEDDGRVSNWEIATGFIPYGTKNPFEPDSENYLNIIFDGRRLKSYESLPRLFKHIPPPPATETTKTEEPRHD